MSGERQLLNLERQAKVAVERGQWALAEDRLKKLLAAAPETWAFQRLLAQVLREQARNDEAEAVLVGAVKRVPDEAAEDARELLLELADLRLALGRPGDAARALRRVLEREPNQWEALYLLGNAFSDAGAHAEAIASYRQSLESNPFEPETWWNFALALESHGESSAAAAAYEAWLEQAKGAADAERADVEARIAILRR